MAKSLINNSGYAVTLYYSVKSKEEVLYFDLLNKLSQNGSGLTFIPWYSTERGRLSAKGISEIDDKLFEKDIYICGPPPMMKGLIDQFVKINIKKSHIHSEEFTMS
jgi:predicted ferric reductase